MPKLKTPLFPNEVSQFSKAHNEPLYDELMQRARMLQNPKVLEINEAMLKQGLLNYYGRNKITTTAQFSELTRVFTHHQVLPLMDDFLCLKRQHGTPLEQQLYATMTICEFIDRLLNRRPLTFYNPNDTYHFLGSQRIKEGGFEKVPYNTTGDLTLAKTLSYDEMLISAFLGVSGPTYFLNTGNWANAGKPMPVDQYHEYGYFIGQVGPRLEKPGVMEWQHLIITESQNTQENGYGKNADPENANTQLLRLFARFYFLDQDAYFPTFDEIKKYCEKYPLSKRYIYFASIKGYLDAKLYKQRMQLVIEPFLFECNDRAAESPGKQQASVHAIGLGLGAWHLRPKHIQEALLVEVYTDILSTRVFPHIHTIYFSHFDTTHRCGDVYNGALFPNTDIRICFSKRNPADPLMGNHLLTAQYAWDSNAFVGNEFWIGNYDTSSDAAAACCSQITLLQNPIVNERVSGINTYFWGDTQQKWHTLKDRAPNEEQLPLSQSIAHITSHEELRQHYELDALAVQFAIAKKTRDINDNRVLKCNIILNRLEKMALHPACSDAKLAHESQMWIQRKAKMVGNSDPRSTITRFASEGVRASLGATLSTLLFQGNTVEDAQSKRRIPYITLDNSTGLTIYIPDYDQNVSIEQKYGFRLYQALIRVGFQSLLYANCDERNAYGDFISFLQIMDPADIICLIETVCGFTPIATTDLFKVTRYQYSPPPTVSTSSAVGVDAPGPAPR